MISVAVIEAMEIRLSVKLIETEALLLGLNNIIVYLDILKC